MRYDVKFLLETYEGRKFLTEVIRDTGALASPYAYVNAERDYACGKQAVGLDLFHSILATDTKALVTMMDEQNYRDEQEVLNNDRERRKSDFREDFTGDIERGANRGGDVDSGASYIPADGGIESFGG